MRSLSGSVLDSISREFNPHHSDHFCFTIKLMFRFLLTCGGLALILLCEEITWRKKWLTGEYQRKLSHIMLGLFAATWPWFLSWNQIKLFGLLALAFTLLNTNTKYFHYLGLVKRTTYGDIFYALAIAILPLLTTNKVFFAIAILHVAIADAMAAIIGTAFGMRYAYKILDQTKTILGTMTFWICSLLILGALLPFAWESADYRSYTVLLISLPPTMALLENLAVFGFDNLAVPLAVVLILQNSSII